MLSESDSEYEYRDSFWWKSLVDVPPRKHYTKQKGEQRRPLLAGPELSAASSKAQEELAKLEDARSEKEHIRHVAEHGNVDKTDYQDSGDATDTEIAEIDSLSKKLKQQAKVLTDKKRLLIREKKEEDKKKKDEEKRLRLLEREERDRKRADEVKRHEDEKQQKAEEDRKRSLETESAMDVTQSGDTNKDDWVTPVKKNKKKKRKTRSRGSPSPSSSREPTPEPVAVVVEEEVDTATDDDNTSINSETEKVELGLESGKDEPEEDMPPDMTTKIIWENAKADFAVRQPKCFAECRKGSKAWGIPGPVDKDGQSDDEEWLRQERTDTSPNKFYSVWCNKLNDWPAPYYNYDQKWKLKWAIDNYHVKNNNTCPFGVCVNEKEKAKIYISRPRFLRHMVEVHLHHHAVYRCSTERGIECKKCNGVKTVRRGALVRHLRSTHGKSASVALDMVTELHEKLMSNMHDMSWKGVTSGSKYFGEVIWSDKGKLLAEFTLSHKPERLQLDDASWLSVRYHRGDTDVSKGKDGKLFSSRDPKDNRDAKRMRMTPSQLSRKQDRAQKFPESVPESDSGLTYRSPLTALEQSMTASSTQAWTQKPSASKGRSDTRDDQFPDLGKPGPESQSLTSTGKPKPKPGTPSVRKRPHPEDAPEGAIFTQFDGRQFFKEEDKMHAEIQQQAFDMWQSGYHTMVNQTANAVKSLTLAAIQQIHDNEILAIGRDQKALVSDVLSQAQQARDEHEAATGYLEDRMAKLEQSHHRQNIRFRAVFGCNLEEWDGSLESAEAKLLRMKKLREQRRQLDFQLKSTPPKGPPPPPPPPPSAGSSVAAK